MQQLLLDALFPHRQRTVRSLYALGWLFICCAYAAPAAAQPPTAKFPEPAVVETQVEPAQAPAAEVPVTQVPAAQQPTAETPVTEAPTAAATLPPRAPAAARRSLFTESKDVSEPDAKPPSSGIGYLVAGGVLTGLGVLNAVGFGVCFMDAYPANARDVCKVASAIVSGVGLTIGIPLLIVGSNQRAEFKAWKEQHARAPRLGVQAGRQSFVLNIAATF